LPSSIPRDLERFGYTVHFFDSVEAVLDHMRCERVFLTICEPRINGISAVESIPTIKRVSPETGLAVVTAAASVAAAVRAVRLGADAYIPLPTSAGAILNAVAGEKHASSEQPMSLDRAIWEYLNQALETTGSISAAARLLGLHRKSLQRMLAKHGPPMHTPTKQRLTPGES